MKSLLKISSVFILSASLVIQSDVYAAKTSHHPVDGILKQAQFVSVTDSNKMIEFNVWFKLRNEDQLDVRLREIYNPNSKFYHQYFTPEQFYANFLPTEKDVIKVKKYLISKGFSIVSAKKNHFYMRVKGSVANIEREFRVKINNYRFKNRPIYSNDKIPFISKELSPLVSGINSINNIPPFRSKCTSISQTPGSNFTPIYGLGSSLQATLLDPQGNVIVPQMTFTGFIPIGANGGGYTPAQIQHAYGVDQLVNQGINGLGQTVVIIDTCLSPSLQQDINAFTSANNLPTLTIGSNLILQNYGTAHLCEYGSVAQQEETIDVEGFHTTAPNANIILALSTSLDTLTLLSDAIQQNAVPGYLFSVSHSNPELITGFNIESSLKFAAGVGMSVNISSGDCGDNTIFQDANFQKQVNYPSSSTWVTAVGGTALFLDNNGNYLTETGWGTARNISYLCVASAGPVCTAYIPTYSNQGANPQGFVEGTTGGISKLYPAQPWQQNAISGLFAGGYGVVGTFIYSQNPLTLFRAVPDISMFAEADYPAFEIYITLINGGSPAPFVGEGTSLACPLFTGILTLVNQYRAALSKSPIGLATAYLYSLPAGAVRPINNPHGMGNPVAGIPDPNAFQLFQVDPLTGNLLGIVFNQDSSLTLGPFWSDVTGVGSPYAPIFVPTLAAK